MSGICGVLARDRERRLPDTAVDAMCRRLPSGTHAPDPDRVSTWASGRVQLGASLFGANVGGVVHATRDGIPIVLALDATLYGADAPPPGSAATRSAEILLERYFREGISFLERIDGEASLAIWDGRTEELFLATDRFRLHPLYYSDRPDQFVFGSRIGSILASPLPVTRDIRPDAIADTVANSIIPTPKTVFRDVFKMPPAHLLVHRAGTTTLSPYWTADFTHPRRAREGELAVELRARFAEAIARRLRADGPPDAVGSFLSGGVDSSTVTGVLMQAAGRTMKSFSIGFGEARYNEISYARIAARELRAEHFEYFVVPPDVPTVLPELLAAFDEPYGNASAVPTYFCARLAREHGVNILYAGDGGDELFAGNERYSTQHVFEYYGRIPALLRRGLIEPTVGTLAKVLPLDLFVKGTKYIRRANLPPAKRLTSYDFFRIVPVDRFLTPEFLEEVGRDYNPGATLEALHDAARASTELDRQLYLDLHLTISDNDILKVTRMAEAAGVTVRFPFLDRELAEFAMEVPAGIKMRGRHLRTFFKRAYADILPPEVREKSKHGFGLPIAEWLRTNPVLADMLHDLILGPRALARGYFRKEALEDLLDNHRTDPTSFFGTTLWNLMILELWHRRLEDEGRGAAANPGTLP